MPHGHKLSSCHIYSSSVEWIAQNGNLDTLRLLACFVYAYFVLASREAWRYFLHIFLICYTTRPLKLAWYNLCIFLSSFLLLLFVPPLPQSWRATHICFEWLVYIYVVIICNSLWLLTHGNTASLHLCPFPSLLLLLLFKYEPITSLKENITTSIYSQKRSYTVDVLF